MAMVLTGNSNVFDALVFGQGNRTGQAFIDNLNQSFMQNVSAPVLDTFNYLMQTSMFQSFRQDALAHLQTMDIAHSLIMQPNSVYQLNDIGQLQHATTTMQRWIMANPIIGQMHQQHQLDGYSDTYVSRSTGEYGIDNYDYRRVTNGITMEHTPGEMSCWNWTESLLTDNDDLTFLEQVAIKNTWDNALCYIIDKYDPTSVYNDRLD